MYDNFDIGHDLKMAFEDGYRAGVEAAQTKWISINNPPKEGGRYMILFEDGHCCDAVFDNSIDDGGKFGEWEGIYDTTVHAFIVTEWCEYESVTHWMPLLGLAPQKEDEERNLLNISRKHS